MTLRSRLLLAQAPLIVGLAVIAVVGATLTASIGDSAARILEDNYRSVLAAQRMKESIERIDSAALFLALGERERSRALAPSHIAAIEEELAVQEGNITEKGEQEVTARLRAAWQDYRQRFARLERLPAAELESSYFSDLLPAFNRVKGAADEILTLNQDAMVRKRDAAERQAARFRTLLAVSAVLGLLLAIVLSTLLTSRLLRPLGVLGQSVRRIGQGDLASRAVVHGSDELAALAADFNAMADKLSQYRRSSLGELLEAQQGAQAAIDSLPDPVVVVGPVGRDARQLNTAAASLLRIDPDASGPSAMAAMEPSVREVVERVREHVASGRGPLVPRGLEDAVRLPTAEGERSFLARGTPVYDEAGAVSAVTVVLQDVTRLVRFDELKNNLVATVAHEFRTPLTSLRMAIHLLTEGLAGPLTEKQADLLHAGREDCERLQSFVDELLDLSRIQAGRIELRTQAIEVEAAVDLALDAHRAAAAARQVELRSDILPGSGQVTADPDRLQLVFANLLSNAIRHSPAGERVTVSVSPAGDRLRVAVVDHGPGIPREHQQSIFDRFVRMPGTPDRGAGLGLYIARELVTAHGGEIGVVSEPGQGATFWFTIPRVPPTRGTMADR